MTLELVTEIKRVVSLKLDTKSETIANSFRFKTVSTFSESLKNKCKIIVQREHLELYRL